MNPADILVLALILAAACTVMFFIRKNRHRGGCSGCSGCSVYPSGKKACCRQKK